jgi:hypothetical protein
MGGLSTRRAEKKARAKANAEGWKEKKRKALEDFRAKKAAQREAELRMTDERRAAFNPNCLSRRRR